MNTFKLVPNENISFSRKALVENLLNDQSHHIEFNGHLTNHNKHAVIALYGLGASKERIQGYYSSYAQCTPYGYGLEPPKISKYSIIEENWKNYLGKRSSFSSYCKFFDDREKELGMNELIKKYAFTLLPGWVGSLTHATIHLGWALEVKHRWMAIEGLAYMAFSYVSCHPERTVGIKLDVLTKDRTALESLFYIANFFEEKSVELKRWVEELIEAKCKLTQEIHPELARSGLQYRIARLLQEGHPLIYSTIDWISNGDITNNWKQLHYVVTLIYLAYPGDFLILHLLTSLHAMEQIAAYLSIDQQRYTIQCFWVGMLCILFSRGEFPRRSVLEELDLKYNDASDANNSECEINWKRIVARAIEEEEEHNPKLVYVLRRMWNISGKLSIFRIAASYFTTTPELPKSFEIPPTAD
ncbi:MAG: questin oxidase family protein [Proteobacteria bacterium]|nr:questin oxidase family protein [Pseudomonadota bacterium]